MEARGMVSCRHHCINTVVHRHFCPLTYMPLLPMMAASLSTCLWGTVFITHQPPTSWLSTFLCYMQGHYCETVEA